MRIPILITLFACSTSAEPITTAESPSLVFEERVLETDPEAVAREIEDAADPMIEEELEILRETIKELHGQAAVEAIIAEREAALKTAAADLAAQRTQSAEDEAEAVKEAVEIAQAEPPVIQNGKAGKKHAKGE